jgi:hypothetical protein
VGIGGGMYASAQGIQLEGELVSLEDPEIQTNGGVANLAQGL